MARELAEQTKGLLRPGDVPSTVRAMAQLVELLDVQLRNLTPGGKDSAARSLTKVLPKDTLGECVQSDRVKQTFLQASAFIGLTGNQKKYGGVRKRKQIGEGGPLELTER